MSVDSVRRVRPAGRAVASRRARHLGHVGVQAGVQRPQAGHLDRLAPGAVPLADHEPLSALRTVQVGPAGRAVARRRARHRPHLGVPGRVQRRQAGHLDRLAPGAGLGDRDRGRRGPGFLCARDRQRRSAHHHHDRTRQDHPDPEPSHRTLTKTSARAATKPGGISGTPGADCQHANPDNDHI